MGANAGRLAQTARDAFRALSQVRGSPADSVRPVQTGRSWLGAKGSRVQIPPSRLVKHVFGFNFREPIGGANGFPGAGAGELGGVRLQGAVHGGGVIGEGGPDLVMARASSVWSPASRDRTTGRGPVSAGLDGLQEHGARLDPK